MGAAQQVGDVAVVSIENPYGLIEAHTINDRGEVVPGTVPKITAIRSLRGDPLAKLLERGTIDQECYDAGRTWQRVYESAEVGSVSSIDPAKEAVDGGRIREVFTDRQRTAMGAMREINAQMEPAEITLLHAVLGEGMSLSAVALAYGWPQTWRKIQELGEGLKETLKKLSQVLDGVDTRRGLG
jgi:hypothetical protein